MQPHAGDIRIMQGNGLGCPAALDPVHQRAAIGGSKVDHIELLLPARNSGMKLHKNAICSAWGGYGKEYAFQFGMLSAGALNAATLGRGVQRPAYRSGQGGYHTHQPDQSEPE